MGIDWLDNNTKKNYKDMVGYIDNLNKTYKSGQFSLVNGIMVVEVKKVRHYNVLLSTKQREWISSFCLKVSNNCLKHITKALAGAIIDTHQKYPHLEFYIKWA